MKIQIFNGSVEFLDGTMTRHMDRQVFLQSGMGQSSKVVVANGPWITYNFKPEAGVACDAIFRDDRLHQVCFLMHIRSDDASQWTAELEQERKLKHDTWLRAELGAPPYEYPWGSVTSDFDPRGCVSDIIVSYGDWRSD